MHRGEPHTPSLSLHVHLPLPVSVSLSSLSLSLSSPSLPSHCPLLSCPSVHRATQRRWSPLQCVRCERALHRTCCLLSFTVHCCDVDAGTIVASSFGKLTRPQSRDDAKAEDLALATLLMISGNVGVIAKLHADLHQCKHIMCVRSRPARSDRIRSEVCPGGTIGVFRSHSDAAGSFHALGQDNAPHGGARDRSRSGSNAQIPPLFRAAANTAGAWVCWPCISEGRHDASTG